MFVFSNWVLPLPPFMFSSSSVVLIIIIIDKSDIPTDLATMSSRRNVYPVTTSREEQLKKRDICDITKIQPAHGLQVGKCIDLFILWRVINMHSKFTDSAACSYLVWSKHYRDISNNKKQHLHPTQMKLILFTTHSGSNLAGWAIIKIMWTLPKQTKCF